MTMDTLLEQIETGALTERQMTELPCEGESPWGGTDCPAGVWAWDETCDQVLIGEDAFSIVSYDEVRAIYQ